LGVIRQKMGKDLGYCDSKTFAFCWIVDFPMFEYNEEAQRFEAAHHMFTMPQAQYIDTMEQNPGDVIADLYDLVLNGYELASGSIRIHDPELQKRVFRVVGYSDEQAAERFGFLLDAFQYGTPPHGGIAPGLDRLLMLMTGQETIREVIAFPKNTQGIAPMEQAPSPIDTVQWDELQLMQKPQ
jgi:aspartyl-tRNA synthetase